MRNGVMRVPMPNSMGTGISIHNYIENKLRTLIAGTNIQLDISDDGSNIKIKSLATTQTIGAEPAFTKNTAFNLNKSDSYAEDDTNKVASAKAVKLLKDYVDTELASLISSSPDTLATLNDLADALGNDPDFASTITTMIGEKLPHGGYEGTAVDIINSMNALKYQDINMNYDNVEPVLFYYGYPIAYKAMWDVDLIVNEIAKYKIWVVGDEYNYPTHEEYISTTEIITAVRAKGVKVYGYIPLGVSTDNRTIATLQSEVDKWVDLNVDGIFIDEFGFDYGVTRQRQIDIVDYVHGKGLPFCANAYVWADVMVDGIANIPFAIDDWRYTQYSAGNPTNLPLTRNSDDIFLFEEYASNPEKAMDEYELHERVKLCTDYMTSNDVDMKLWGLSIVAQSGNTPTIPTNFRDWDDFVRYSWSNAYIHKLDGHGISGVNIGANGSDVIESNIYTLQLNAGAPSEVTYDWTNSIFTRDYGNVRVTVKTKSDEMYYNIAGDILSNGSDMFHTHLPSEVGSEPAFDKNDGFNLPKSDSYNENDTNKVASAKAVKLLKDYVDTELAGLIDSSPDTLNTLNEIAAALGDDANFAATVTTSLGTKLPHGGYTGSAQDIITIINELSYGDVSALSDSKTISVGNGLSITSEGLLNSEPTINVDVGSTTVMGIVQLLDSITSSSTTKAATANSVYQLKLAMELYTNNAISNLIESSPDTLNTLNELAAALGDDPNFATTMTTSIATKLPHGGYMGSAQDIVDARPITSYTSLSTLGLTDTDFPDNDSATALSTILNVMGDESILKINISDTYPNLKSCCSSIDGVLHIYKKDNSYNNMMITTITGATYTGTYYTSTTTFYGWNKVYDSGNKPTAIDIDAVSKASGGTFTGYVNFTSGLSTQGKDVYLSGGAILSGDANGANTDRTGTNIDHIWFDDSTDTWNFCSDTTYKGSANATMACGILQLDGWSIKVVS